MAYFPQFFDGGFSHHHQNDSDEEHEEKNSLYKLLGVSTDATQREISRAYRKLAQKAHPDRGGNEEKFKELQEAYEILSDESKRRSYDRYGLNGMKNGMGMNDSFFQMFDSGGRSAQRKRSRNPLLKKTIWITLADVCHGPSTHIEVEYLTADYGGTCTTCGGTGNVLQAVHRGNMVLQHRIGCKRCEGQGVYYRKKRYEKKQVQIQIPKGCIDGQKLTLDNCGHELPDENVSGKAAFGDVEVTVKVRHHPQFKRVGADLNYQKQLTLKEAICGFEMEFPHVNGTTVLRYSDPGGIRQDQVKVFKGFGVPQLGGHLGMDGNLVVQFEIVFPESGQITAPIAKQLKAIFSARNVTWEKIKKRLTQQDVIMEGSRVMLVGLKNYPRLNNSTCTVKHKNDKNRWALMVDGDSKKMISVPTENLRLIKEENKGRRGNSQLQKENDYEEEVEGVWATEENIEVTPAKADGGAFDQDERKECRRRGDICQQQ